MGVLPTEQVEQLQKGTIDGVFIDYGGAGIAFKMGGILKYSTEMYSYVSSFGLAMNEDFWAKLPPDLQTLVSTSVTGHRKGDRRRRGMGWTCPARRRSSTAAPRRSASRPRRTRSSAEIGAEVSDAKVKELEGKGLPARAVLDMMRVARREARQDLEELLGLRPQGSPADADPAAHG